MSFILSNIAFADAPKASIVDVKQQSQITTDPDKIVIPRDFGLIKSRYAAKNSQRLVIHIQDAHCNYEAQSNIIKILECLIKNDGLGLVSVEGADGFIDTSWFKAFPDADIRKEVADYFMKKGEITGPEFLSITGNYPIKLFGAETRAYYIENLNAFTSSYPLKEDTEKYFNQIKSALNKLKATIYSDELKEFDAKSQDYETKKIAFADYVKYLEGLSGKYKLSMRQYDNLFKLVSVLVYEKKINFNVVDKERSTLIDTITKKLDKEQLAELVNKSLEFKMGKISSAEYYEYIKAMAAKYGIALSDDYPNLFNYIIYNSVYSRIENESLFKEIKRFEEALREKLFVNDDQKTLDKLSRHINILLGLVNIRLLNDDFDYYKAHQEEFAHEIFASFIGKMAGKFGFAFEVDRPSDAVRESMLKLEDFYKIAVKRDKALVDNTIEAMNKENAQISVLVTGGFHSEGITKLLEEQGVSYIVVCPSITKDVETPYIKILTNQRTPLEEILSDTGATKTADAKNVRAGTLAPYLITAARMNMDSFAKIKEIGPRAKTDLYDWTKRSIELWLPKARADLVKISPSPDADLLTARFNSDVEKAVDEYIAANKLKSSAIKNVRTNAASVRSLAKSVIVDILARLSKAAAKKDDHGYSGFDYTNPEYDPESQYGLDRRQAVQEAAESIFRDIIPAEKLKSAKILDCATGRGLIAGFALEYGAKEVVALDHAANMLKSTKKGLDGSKVRFVEGDMFDLDTNLKNPDGTPEEFDYVTIGNVLCFYKDDAVRKKFFEQVYRHLKPGGQIIILEGTRYVSLKNPKDMSMEVSEDFQEIMRPYVQALTGAGYLGARVYCPSKEYDEDLGLELSEQHVLMNENVIVTASKENVNPFMLFESGVYRGNTAIDENTVVIGTGGGDCAGLNDFIANLVIEQNKKGRRVVGIKNCYDGMVSDNWQDLLVELTPGIAAAMKGLPSTVIGSCRRKLSDKDLEKITQRFGKAKVIVITGGNDHLKGAGQIAEYGANKGLKITTIGVPKSIDNDFETGAMLGFESASLAARNIAARASIDPRASDGKTAAVFEVMGRKCGSLTLKASEGCPYAKGVLIPEYPISIQEIVDLAKNNGVRNFFVSEGVVIKNHDPLLQKLLDADPVLRKMHDKATKVPKEVTLLIKELSLKGFRALTPQSFFLLEDAKMKQLIEGDQDLLRRYKEAKKLLDYDAHGNPKLTGTSLYICSILKHLCGLRVERTDLTYGLRGAYPAANDAGVNFDGFLGRSFALEASRLIEEGRTGLALTYPAYDNTLQRVVAKPVALVYASRNLNDLFSKSEMAGLGVAGIEGYPPLIKNAGASRQSAKDVSLEREMRKLFYCISISTRTHKGVSCVEFTEPSEAIIMALRGQELDAGNEALKPVVESTKDSILILIPEGNRTFDEIAEKVSEIYNKFGYVNVAISSNFKLIKDLRKDKCLKEILDKDPILKAKFENEAIDAGEGYVRFEHGVSNFIVGLFKAVGAKAGVKVSTRVTDLGNSFKGLKKITLSCEEAYSSPEKFQRYVEARIPVLIEAVPELEKMIEGYRAKFASFDQKLSEMREEYNRIPEKDVKERESQAALIKAFKDSVNKDKKMESSRIDKIIRLKYNFKVAEHFMGPEGTLENLDGSNVLKQISNRSDFMKDPKYSQYRAKARELRFSSGITRIDVWGGAASRLFGDGQDRDVSISYAAHDIYDVAVANGFMNEEKLRNEKVILGLSVASRIMLQKYMYIEEEIRRYYEYVGIKKTEEEIKKEREGIVRSTPRIVLINGENGRSVIDEFLKNDFYGSDPRLTVFVTQSSYHGWKIVGGKPALNENSTLFPAGHGEATMQILQEGRAFTVDKNGYVAMLKDSAVDYLMKETKNAVKMFIESRVNDMTKLGASRNVSADGYTINSIDMDIFALALEKMGDLESLKGSNVILEQVAQDMKNPIKGGSPLIVAGKKIQLEELAQSEKISGLVAKDDVPFNRFFIFYKPLTLTEVMKKQGLPVYFRFRDGYIYPETVTGDVTMLEGANADYVLESSRLLNDYKSVDTLNNGVDAALSQDKNPTFSIYAKELLEKEKTVKITALPDAEAMKVPGLVKKAGVNTPAGDVTSKVGTGDGDRGAFRVPIPIYDKGFSSEEHAQYNKLIGESMDDNLLFGNEAYSLVRSNGNIQSGGVRLPLIKESELLGEEKKLHDMFNNRGVTINIIPRLTGILSDAGITGVIAHYHTQSRTIDIDAGTYKYLLSLSKGDCAKITETHIGNNSNGLDIVAKILEHDIKHIENPIRPDEKADNYEDRINEALKDRNLNEVEIGVLLEYHNMSEAEAFKSKNNFEKYALMEIVRRLSSARKNGKEIDDGIIGKLNAYPHPLIPGRIFYLDDFKDRARGSSQLIAEAVDMVIRGKTVNQFLFAGAATRIKELSGGDAKYFFSVKQLIDKNKEEYLKKIEPKHIPILEGMVNKENKYEVTEEEKEGLIKDGISKKELEDFTIYQIVSDIQKNQDFRGIQDIELGARELIQYRLELERLVSECYGKDNPNLPVRIKEAIRNAKFIIHVNEKSGKRIVDSFKKWNFFGFEKDNVVFITQDEFFGYRLDRDKSGNIDKVQDKDTSRPYGHGYTLMQTVEPGTGYTIDTNGEKRIIEGQAPLEYLRKRGASLMANSNVDDWTKLKSAIDKDRLAQALYLMQSHGAGVVVEVVKNIKGQKGGYWLRDPITHEEILVEGLAMKDHILVRDKNNLQNILIRDGPINGSLYENLNNDKVVKSRFLREETFLNKMSNFYDINRLLKELPKKGLPNYLDSRDGIFHLESVTGDVTHVIKSEAFAKKGEEILSFKNASDAEGTLMRMLEQDRDPEFDNLARRILHGTEGVGAIRMKGGSYTTHEHWMVINEAISKLIREGRAPVALSLKGDTLPGDKNIPLIFSGAGNLKIKELENKLSPLNINFIVIKGLNKELQKIGVAQDLVFHYGVTRRSVYMDEDDFIYLFNLNNGVDIIREAAVHEKAHIDNHRKSEEEIEKIASTYRVRMALMLRDIKDKRVSLGKISEEELAIPRVFGTNGIRSDDIGEDGLRRITAGTAEILKAKFQKDHPGKDLPCIMVGSDPRPQGAKGFRPGEMSGSKAVAETLAAYGFKVLLVPEPVAAPFMISMTGKGVHPKDVYASIMITASHNEIVDPKSGRLISGVKLFIDNAPASDAVTGLISERINNKDLARIVPFIRFDKAVADGDIVVISNGDKNDPETIEFNRLSRAFDLPGIGRTFRQRYPDLKIVMNTMNGGMSKFALRVFETMGFQEGKDFKAFNTTFMNDPSMEAKMTGWIQYTDPSTGEQKKVRFAPDPTRPWMRGKDYTDYVNSDPAHIIALLIDGDADRLVAELNKEIIPNDIGMLAAYYLAKYKGQTGYIVRTVPTTGGLDALSVALGLGKTQVTPVGSKWFAGPNKYYNNTLGNILVAVEESGHIGFMKAGAVNNEKELFFDHSIGLSMLMLEMMANTGKTWQELSDEMWAFIKEKTGQERIAALRYGINKDDGAEKYYDLVSRLGNPGEDAFRKDFGSKFESELAASGIPWKVESFDITDSGGAQFKFTGGRKLFPRKSGTDGSVRMYVEVLETERDKAPELVKIMRKVMNYFISNQPGKPEAAVFDHTVGSIMQSSGTGERARKAAEAIFAKAQPTTDAVKYNLIIVKSAIPAEQLASTTVINYANFCASYYNAMEGYTAHIVDNYDEAVKLLAKNANWDKTNTIVGLIDRESLDRMSSALKANGMKDKTKLLPMERLGKEQFSRDQFVPLKGFFDLMSVLVQINRPLDRPEDRELKDAIKDLLNEIGVYDVNSLMNALSVAAYFEDPMKFAKNFIIRLLPPTRAASPAELRDRYNAAKKVVESL